MLSGGRPSRPPAAIDGGSSQAVSDLVRSVLATVAAGRPLGSEEAERFMDAVLDGEVSPAQLGGFLVGLRVRGETAEELTGFVRALRSRAVRVSAPEGTIDTCGTGGDARGTFNVSTATSLVTAAAGVPVAKTGNRAVSGVSGSSDVMVALGLSIEQGAEEVEGSLREEGYAYLHAPTFHPGMRHAGPVRLDLGMRTAFNLIGPLANASLPRRQLMGVPDEGAAQMAAAALHALGTERAFVVSGDRVDELPLDDSGVIYDVSAEGISRREVTAADHGLPFAPTEALTGGDAAANAAIVEAVFRGEERGPRRDVVVLNAGASLQVAGRAEDLRTGVAVASEALDSGAAWDLLERLRARARATATQRAEGAG
ncbi:anthranilate phosphoribosyltransferase [soil metagenome]